MFIKLKHNKSWFGAWLWSDENWLRSRLRSWLLMSEKKERRQYTRQVITCCVVLLFLPLGLVLVLDEVRVKGSELQLDFE